MATLATLLNVPAMKQVDISACYMPAFMKVLKSRLGDDPYGGELNFKHPEMEALDFYLANHVVGLIRTKKGNTKILTKDEEFLVTEYVNRLDDMALRSMAYLLLICSREMRHVKDYSVTKCKIKKDEVIAYETLIAFVSNNFGNKIAEGLWDGSIGCPVGLWTICLEKVFRYGGWHGGYGGGKWADVTLCLKEYIHGVYTAEMMIDVIWTLCHNGGPIFNKGMLYHHHTSDLLRILDVQRAGQVPQFDWDMLKTTTWFKEYLAMAKKCFPELGLPADLVLIKSTALHLALWQGSKYKTSGVIMYKPSVGKVHEIASVKAKMVRDD